MVQTEERIVERQPQGANWMLAFVLGMIVLLLIIFTIGWPFARSTQEQMTPQETGSSETQNEAPPAQDIQMNNDNEGTDFVLPDGEDLPDVNVPDEIDVNVNDGDGDTDPEPQPTQ